MKPLNRKIALDKASDFLGFSPAPGSASVSSRLHEAGFRKLVLMLLLTSGVVLIV